MKYVRKHKEIEAIRLKKDIVLEGVTIPKGNWLVTEGEDQYWLSHEFFISEYEPKVEQTWVPIPLPYDPNPWWVPTYPWVSYTTDKIVWGDPQETTSDNIQINSYLEGEGNSSFMSYYGSNSSAGVEFNIV